MQSNDVRVELYYSADSLDVYSLITEITSYDFNFINNLNFEPFIMTYEAGSNNNKETNHCLGKGKYCSHPRADLANVDGKEFVYEGLRQKCIWSSSTRNETEKWNYFNYMFDFFANCINGKVTEINAKCSKEVRSWLNIDEEKVTKCLKEEMDKIDKNKDNLLLNDRNHTNRYEVFMNPTLLINGRMYRGAMTGLNVLEAICSAYKDKPSVCFTEGVFTVENGISFWSGLFIIILVLVINVAMFLICRKLINKKISENIEEVDVTHKINSLVTNYVAMPNK